MLGLGEEVNCKHPEAVVLLDDAAYDHFMNCLDDASRKYVYKSMRKQAEQGYKCWREQHDVVFEAAVKAARGIL